MGGPPGTGYRLPGLYRALIETHHRSWAMAPLDEELRLSEDYAGDGSDWEARVAQGKAAAQVATAEEIRRGEPWVAILLRPGTRWGVSESVLSPRS